MGSLARLPLATPANEPYDARAHGARCDECPLQKLTPVPPERPKGTVKYAVVAEHPGRYETKLLRPLVGPSGQVFDRALTKAGLARRDGHLTNAALCAGGDDEADLQKAFECCAPRLLNELRDLPPEAPILTMGAPATRTVIGVRSIFMARGFVWTAKLLEGPIKNAEAALRKAIRDKDRPGRKIGEQRLEILKARDMLAGRFVFPTLNSAFILKADSWRPVLEIDIKRMRRWLTGELTKEKLHDSGLHLVVEKQDEVRKALAKLGPVVSLDIETDGVVPMVSPILCVGLASRGQAPIVIGPWGRHRHARLLTEALADRTALMHNGFNFDLIALQRDGVRFPRKENGFLRVEDTLIAHHTYASHMYQRLDHVVSVFCDSSPWKLLAGKRGEGEKGILPVAMAPEARHLYNAKDARLTVTAWDNMQVDLSRETAIYELDKQVAEICQQMQVDGIRRDPERMDHLIERMKRRNRHLAKEMKRLSNRKHFSPTKLQDIRRALFGTLRAPIVKLTPKGLVSTSSGTLEALKMSRTRVGKFSRYLLDWRAIDKVRSTYLERVEVLKDGRVHPNWKSYGAVTGRFACRLQSVPRLVFTRRAQILLARGAKPKEVVAELGIDATYEIESRIREVYIPDPDHAFVYFDLSQSEMRVAAYISGDDAFIQSCESGDVHTANAKVLFASSEEAMEVLARDPKGEGKFYRDVCKNAGFGILYKADVETIFLFLKSKGFDVDMGDVQVMFDTLHETYHRYYKFCDEKLTFCQKNGYLRGINSGRIRRFGFHPKPTDVYNFCLDDQTEALTREGWKLGVDLKPGDFLLTKEALTGAFEWKPIARMTIDRKYRGELVEFKSSAFNAVSTPNHRWLVYDRDRRENRCVLTDDLARGSGTLRIHRTGAYRGASSPTYSDDFVELCGWVLTDGSIRPDRVTVCQSDRANTRKVRDIRRLLARLRLQPNEAKNEETGVITWSMFNGTETVHVIRRLFVDRTLTMSFLLSLTSSQLRVLFETMLDGDGHRAPTPTFFSRSKAGADAFATLCLMCGRAANVSWIKGQRSKGSAKIANKPVGRGGWQVSVLNRDKAQVIVHRRRYGKAKKTVDQVLRIRSRGPVTVWCPTVPNGFFVARRQGKMFVTGNSVQEFVAYLMNERMIELWKRKPRGVRIVVQAHDALVCETRLGADTDATVALLKDIWARPILVQSSSRTFVMPIDLKVGGRLSDF